MVLQLQEEIRRVKRVGGTENEEGEIVEVQAERKDKEMLKLDLKLIKSSKRKENIAEDRQKEATGTIESSIDPSPSFP